MIADLAYREVRGWHGAIDLYVPEGPGPHPVLIYFHGGGWRMGSKASAAQHAGAWNAMGLAVAAPAYRLAGAAPAPAAADDALAALEWVREHGTGHGLDAGRIVAAGHSAGGLLALATAYRAADPPAAVVAWNAQCDLARYREERLTAGDPVAWLEEADDPEGVALSLSPLHAVRPGLPPTLLVHSDRDPRAPYRDAVLLEQALVASGVPAELVTMCSDGHLTAEHPPAEVARGHDRTRLFLGWQGVLNAPASPAQKSLHMTTR
ncbi:alpha/beta hydrolase [Sphingomonas canadensis]|uniref:Alpha/beta hydrolase n=1 Tax=Sphingomonas canadensis TaxID=1219257 RepID=A0ABW3H9R0_9SPHN|nr:alpha/beta hydrolase [Sphingomonas canadensis]MCW3837609.1 alpha/beta hydrolase [Sphingomonas canadensis]